MLNPPTYAADDLARAMADRDLAREQVEALNAEVTRLRLAIAELLDSGEWFLSEADDAYVFKIFLSDAQHTATEALLWKGPSADA